MLSIFIVFLLWGSEPTQTTEPSTPVERAKSWELREQAWEKSPIKAAKFRPVGPRSMSGRAIAVQGFEDHPNTYFVGYASGGLWRTVDNGVTWQPLFDHMPSITIGHMMVNPKNLNEIWVGTGEDNSSRSSYAGTGIYHSIDGGKSWESKGLSDTHHISTIHIDPRDSKTLVVSAIGHLYSNNEERGIFRTTDAGKTWKKVLYINDYTGVIHLVADPSNPDRLYASSWERSRKAWDFKEAGEGSGIYISTDAGLSWKKSNKGLPIGPHLGRIGLTVSASNPKVLYAYVDNQTPRSDEEEDDDQDEAEDGPKITSKDLAKMESKDVLALDDKTIKVALKELGLNKELTVEKVRKGFEDGSITIEKILHHLGTNKQDLIVNRVRGLEIYRSDNRGKSWKKTHDQILDYVFSYGYYFGRVYVAPDNEDTIYVLGVPFMKSTDGGKTFKGLSRKNLHSDHHALWINPKNPQHIVNGNDGGVNMSWDGGENWTHYNSMHVGQFYTVAYDMATPYNIYGGLQDNGTWYGSSLEADQYSTPWEFIGGGDGAFVQVDFRDNKTVYSGSQFGRSSRKDLQTGKRSFFRISHKFGEDPYRFNWMSPLHLSRHHQDVLYFGSQRVLRSLDKGDTWEPISPDLTHNQNIGDVPYATITALTESKQEFGTLYAGTDDGRLWVRRGAEFEEISEITNGLWVSSIETSPHEDGTVFVTLTGYRNDDFKTYVYETRDFGKSWRSLKGDLPEEACNVIRQDRKNAETLYLGTDIGLWVSFNRGENWLPHHKAGMPNVPVYAMEIHPRENELIAATHGRSIFVLPLKQISQIKPEMFDKDFLVFEKDLEESINRDWGGQWATWANFNRDNLPHQKFWFMSNEKGKVHLSIHKDDTELHKQTINHTSGLNYIRWNFQLKKHKGAHKGDDDHYYPGKGEYKVILEKGKQKEELTFTFK